MFRFNRRAIDRSERRVSYHNRRGLPATYIGQVRALSTYAPEVTNGDHPGLGTLLYTRPLDTTTQPGQ